MDPRDYFSELYRSLDRFEVQDEHARVLTQAAGLSGVIEWIEKLQKKKGKVIFVGNGGSAAIASHQAVDLWKNGGIRAVAFNDASLLTCLSNDYSYAEVFEKSLAMFAEPEDVLIAISSSGKSANILKAVDKARSIGCRVATLSGFKPDNPLRTKGHLNFYVSSESYGMVEVAHLTLCHYITDHFVARAASASK
ncbi:MAG: SIS domain-containing protein [Candidatus Omnitrophota bacterium]